MKRARAVRVISGLDTRYAVLGMWLFRLFLIAKKNDQEQAGVDMRVGRESQG